MGPFEEAIRDRFAAAALTGLLAALSTASISDFNPDSFAALPVSLATHSYRIADAMLAARAKPSEGK